MVGPLVTLLPSWWPPTGYDPLTEDQVRELFAHLKTVVPPVMEDARRRIQSRIGDDPIEMHPETVRSLSRRRLGRVEVVPLVHLWARTGPDAVSVAIGIRADGQLAILEGTPERRQQEWRVWESGAWGQ